MLQLKEYKNSSFKSSENIKKKECGPDRSVSNSYRGIYFYITAVMPKFSNRKFRGNPATGSGENF